MKARQHSDEQKGSLKTYFNRWKSRIRRLDSITSPQSVSNLGSYLSPGAIMAVHRWHSTADVLESFKCLWHIFQPCRQGLLH